MSKILLGGASLGALVAVFAGPAYAQGASAAADDNVESVTVVGTGSLIKGIAATGSNMISIDADAMKQGGALTTNQIMEQVPQLANAFNNNVAAPTAGNFSGFRPQLRSLPSQNIVGGSATLLLTDGQNMVGVSALGTAPDASVIPTVAIQRVDVLPDGASATYGANAITGVINFITRDSFDGLQIETDLGAADSYTAFHASAIGGTSWNGGSAYLAIDHTENTVLMGGDRHYTRMDLTDIGGRDSRSTTCPLPNITAGGTIYAQTGYPTGAAGQPNALASNVVASPGLDAHSNAGGGNRCDTNASTSTYPSVNQTGLFGSLRQELADGVVFSAKMLWNSRSQFSLGPQTSSTQTITDSNPFFQSLGGETSQRVQFSFAPLLGNNERKNQNNVQVFQVSPKLTAALPFGDWEAVLMGNYGRSSTNAVQHHSLNSALLTTAISQGVGGQYFDPYNIGQTDATLLGNILGSTTGQNARQHLEQVQLTFDGSLFELPGGPVKVAIGGRYDWEDYVANWNNTTAIATPVGIHRVVTSAFAEVHVPVVGADNRMPLVYSLDLSVSGRSDNYSVFGSTNNYKLGVSYQPFEELTFRATRGTSYDAPSLADTSAPDGRYQLSLYNAPNPYVPPGTSLADSLRPSILVPGGNPNLTPELGSTWSLGAELKPGDMGGIDLTGLDLNVTYYHVSIENQIGLLYNNLQEFVVPNYSNLYIINPSVAQASVYGYANLTNFPGTTLASGWGTSPAGGGPDDPYILYDARRNNLGSARLAGIDFSAQYISDFDFGTLSGGFSGTYSLENSTAPNQGGPFTSIQSNTVPLYAVSGFTQLVTGPLTMRGSVNFTPSFQVDPKTQAWTLYGQRRIGSFATVNAHVGYDLSELTSWTNNAEIGLTVNNLLNASPPIYLHGGPNLPANSGIGIIASGGTIGRFFLMSIQKSF